MEKATLDTAIQLGQLFALLTPVANGNKSFSKRLSRLRSRIETQVVLAVAVGTAPEVRNYAQNHIADVYDAVLGACKQHIDVPVLLMKSAEANIVYSLPLRTQATKVSRRHDYSQMLLEDAEALVMEPAQGVAQVVRTEIARQYASAVRNSAWLPILLALGLDVARAAVENVRLIAEHSSPQGRETLAEKMANLATERVVPKKRTQKIKPSAGGLVIELVDEPVAKRASKLKVSAEGLFAIQVVMKPEQLFSHPDIAELSSVAFVGAEPAPTLAQILEAACKPVELASDESPAAVSQRIVDDVVTALVARKKVAQAERLELQKKKQAAADDSAVAALKSLSPAQLSALKRNPDLLHRA